MTRSRAAALAVLEAAASPLRAADVLDAIGGACDQATVYRSLHFLEEGGWAESFVLHCSEHGTERYFVSAGKPHRHFFHCESCHRFIDLGACRLGGLVAELEREYGLEVKSHTLYFSGLCAECRAKGGGA